MDLRPLQVGEGMAVPHFDMDYISDIISSDTPPDISKLPFRNPDSFVAGNIHQFHDTWREIASLSHNDVVEEVVHWIENKVSVHKFFRSFKGNSYDSPIPPHMEFDNNVSCNKFSDFIDRSLLERVCSGAVSVWGKVGEVDPPHLVMPLTVEPTKPRLCHDERFLNLWIKDCPFLFIKSLGFLFWSIQYCLPLTSLFTHFNVLLGNVFPLVWLCRILVFTQTK